MYNLDQEEFDCDSIIILVLNSHEIIDFSDISDYNNIDLLIEPDSEIYIIDSLYIEIIKSYFKIRVLYLMIDIDRRRRIFYT